MMSEAEFWSGLEWRICREFAGMKQGRWRNFWCDGLAAGCFDLEGSRPTIRGVAWICEGTKQEEWEFTLLLPRRFAGREAIRWEELLPRENVTRWLSVDEKGKRIEMEPAIAVHDASDDGGSG